MNSSPIHLLELFRLRRIPLTSQRRALLNVLAEKGFSDIQTLCRLASRRGTHVDRATAYRTLALLRANGLLLPQNSRPLAIPSPSASGDQLQFLCECCGKPQPITGRFPQWLRKQLQSRTGFKAATIVLEARGRCRRCAPARRAVPTKKFYRSRV